MNDNFSNTQTVRKAVVRTAGGVVAAQHRVAAQAGAAVLAAGGDSVDAAVATSFALGVVEPWMSGLAAGGCMVLSRADQGHTVHRRHNFMHILTNINRGIFKMYHT